MEEYINSFNGLYFEMGIPARLKRDAQTLEDYYSFQNKFRDCNLYTSVYGMTEPANYKTAVVDRIFFEFDGDGGLNDELLADFRRLLEYCHGETDIRPQVFFSGNRGFHVVIAIEPVALSNPHKCVQKLVENIKSLSGCRYIDLNANNGMAQMRRIPNSQHQKTGLYAVPIDPDMLYFLSPNGVREYAREPKEWIPAQPSKDVVKALHMIDEKIEKWKLYEMLKEPPPPVECNLDDCTAAGEALEGVKFGNRDNALVGLIVYFRKKGLSKEQAYQQLLEWNKKNPQEDNGGDRWIRYKLDYQWDRGFTNHCAWMKKAGFDYCESCPLSPANRN